MYIYIYIYIHIATYLNTMEAISAQRKKGERKEHSAAMGRMYGKGKADINTIYT